jgi:hypothetical protein
MTEGDGIRRNVAFIDPMEKQHLIDAIKTLNTSRFYPGSREDFFLGPPPPEARPRAPAGHVSYWFKQDEIHQATHVHGGPAFLPWHRELCNRFEALLRSVNRNLSLHYWDWTMDPNPLFTADFMGSASGSIGEPWLSAGFYDPSAKPDRDRDKTYNAADPPRDLVRNVGKSGSLRSFSLAEDNRVIYADKYPEMRGILEGLHGSAHGFIGGDIGDGHRAFRDPFVFLLHSNVDRLFAMWQLQHPEWRLNPDLVYGDESGSVAEDRDGEILVGILTPLEPWAGVSAPGAEHGVEEVRPWAPPENEMIVKNSKDPSIVTPPLYDTSLPIPWATIATARKLHAKEMLKESDLIRFKMLGMPEGKVPELKEIPEGKVPEQMPSDVGLFAERLGRIEERLATMQSFIRPDERPQLTKKDRRQVKNNDQKQTEE